MRLVVARDNLCSHQGSMRCERCFPHIVEMQRDGACVLEQVDDGRDLLTLVVVEGQDHRVFALSESDFAPFVGEPWSRILEGIAAFEVSAEEWQDQLDQDRAANEGMSGQE